MAYSFWLKQARKNCKMSLREAAAVFHMSPSTLNRYEEGVITHIPPEKLKMIIDHYGIDPCAGIRQLNARDAVERLSRYQESQRRVDADFLYERWLSLDERGRRNVLNLLLHEAEVTSRLRPKDHRPQGRP